MNNFYKLGNCAALQTLGVKLAGGEGLLAEPEFSETPEYAAMPWHEKHRRGLGAAAGTGVGLAAGMATSLGLGGYLARKGNIGGALATIPLGAAAIPAGLMAGHALGEHTLPTDKRRVLVDQDIQELKDMHDAVRKWRAASPNDSTFRDIEEDIESSYPKLHAKRNKLGMDLTFNSPQEAAQHAKTRETIGDVSGFAGNMVGGTAGGIAGAGMGGLPGSVAGGIAGGLIGEKAVSFPATTAYDTLHDVKQRTQGTYNNTVGGLNAASGIPT